MKILVIEDRAKHIQDAKIFFAGHADIEAVFTSDFKSAMEHLEHEKIDGVVSDIFFSYCNNDERNSKYDCCGVAVMMICWERVIPCILITDGHHHGDSLQWVCSLQRGLLLPEIVDVTTFEEDADWRGEKNWSVALCDLRRLIELGPCKKHNRYDWNVTQLRDGSFKRDC